MKRIAYLLFCAAILFSSCNDDDDIDRNSIAYFQQNISEEMTLREVKSTFGRPDEDVGSGIHVFLYHLDDGTTVVIGVTDTVLYARQVDGNGNLLIELI